MSDASMTGASIERTVPAADAMARAGWALMIALFLAGAAASFIGATSVFNWLSESFLVLAGAVVLAATARQFPLTPLTYGLLLVFALIVFTGAHYTYSHVPLGEWMKHAWHLERNHFDRIAHFFQGAAPAILVREIFRRRVFLRRGALLFCLVSAVCLGVSAAFEILEWHFAVIAGGTQAGDYLGAQGDIWDTQQDMQMALIGSAAAQFVLATWHDRQIARLAGERS